MKRVTALKIAILESGRHQKDIAAEIGLDPATLSRIVNGLYADHPTREAIARAVGCPAMSIWPSHDGDVPASSPVPGTSAGNDFPEAA